jgi:acetyl esterase/lipase
MNNFLKIFPATIAILALFLTQGCTFDASPSLDAAKLGKIERDVTYGMTDGVALKMDIYYPKVANGAVPAVLYVHGGGWTRGDKRAGVGTEDIPELATRGYLVAAINYRLAPQYKFPAQIEDVKCAVRFLRANAAAYGIDPNHIGAWGGSAGGHLVALLGVTDATAGFEGNGDYADQSSRVQAVVDMFGPTDLSAVFQGAAPPLMVQVFGTTDKNSDIIKRASPVTWVSSDDPPFLILHGEKDTLVPLSQSEIFYDRLVAASVPATLITVKNAGHGFVPAGGIIEPSRTEITKMIADFFDKYLK